MVSPIEQTRSGQPEVFFGAGPALYIFSTVADAPIAPCKIGVTTDVKKRLKTIQTSCPNKIILYRRFWFPNMKSARTIEGGFHATQKHLKTNGEWFNIPPETASQIIQLHLKLMFEFYTDCLSSDEKLLAITFCLHGGGN
jgi:hypothetical protein